MNRKFRSIWFLVAGLLAASAQAREEVLSFSQDESGSISANITGLIYYCDPDLGYFDGLPVASVSASIITITSFIRPGECAGSINPHPPPNPYSYSISLGNLADGSYAVDWEYVYKSYFGDPPNQFPPIEHLASFNIESDELAIFKNDFEAAK